MKAITSICLILFFSAANVHAQLRLPALVSDGMVIQRDQKIKVWGWSNPGDKIKIRFRNRNYNTQAALDGKWMLWMNPASAGGPFDMVITNGSDTLTLRDILVGDVWLCAGQSNMVHYLDLHRERYQQDIDNADYAQIRQFVVPTNPVLTGPAEDLPDGAWRPATREHVPTFSVVAFFFARDLYERFKIPIGIINASVGGTPVEAWTSESGLRGFPGVREIIARNKDTAYVHGVNRLASGARRAIDLRRQGDAGLDGDKPWYDPAYEPAGWQQINIPGYLEDQGIKDLDGVVWYRREIDVPASMVNTPARLVFGRIVDADQVYLNGKLVGSKTYQYPQRRYDVPSGVLKAGKNIITVRVVNYSAKGGFVPDKPYYLAAAGDTVDLKGYWQYKVGKVFEPEVSSPGGISLIHQPAALFNGMVGPYTGYGLKGFVWYQGESNTWNPSGYEKFLPALIHDWRAQWQRVNLPFLFVQLPNFMEAAYLPSESQWAELREAQRKALDVPNTAMVVAIDLGEWNDIHPGNKKPIGQRLALAARKLAYGESALVASGPTIARTEVKDNSVVLHFDNAGSGLVSTGGESLRWFAVAGPDRKFRWANAEIRGNTVVISNKEVKHPVYVRYAWADNPHNVNFYNREGLPASPFEVALENADKLWFGKKAAIVLTYDDALDVHLDNAIPILDSLGMNATFYLSVAFPGCAKRIEDWKEVASNGHELGNHTWYHPCDGSKPGRSWVSADNDLSKYSTKEILKEIEMTNLFLQSLDGKQERTFAYTCGDIETGEGSFVDLIKNKFPAIRGVHPQLNHAGEIGFTNIYAYGVDESNQDKMIDWAQQTADENALLVILFHGVGGGHSLNVDLEHHHRFLKWLKENEDDFWVTTMLHAARHLRGREE